MFADMSVTFMSVSGLKDSSRASAEYTGVSSISHITKSANLQASCRMLAFMAAPPVLLRPELPARPQAATHQHGQAQA